MVGISSAKAAFYNSHVCYRASHNGVLDLGLAISLYRKSGILRIRLMEYNLYDVGTLEGMGLEVSFGVNNDELQK
jgi:hypothetical protein